MAVIVKFFWFYLDKIAVFYGEKNLAEQHFLPVKGSSAGGELPKNHHHRPPRLRRSTAARNASSSG